MKKYFLLIFLILISNIIFAEDNYIPVKVKKRVEPKYRKSILPRGSSETVIFTVFVKPDSTIGSIKVNYGNSPFDSLAVRAVRKWDFSPAYLNGKAIFDSLTTSVDFYGKEKIVIDAKKLLKEIVRYDENFRFDYLNQNYLYRENQHLISFYDDEKFYTINNFILPKNFVKRNRQIAEYAIIDSVNFQNEFYPKKYNLPVAYSSLNAGIGDNDMNFGNFFFAKGNPLNIDNSSISFHFFGQKGNWINYEKSFNLNLSVFKKIGNTFFHYNYLKFNEDQPHINFSKYANMNNSETTTGLNSLIISNKILKAGILKYSEKNDLFTQERNHYATFLMKNIKHQNITVSYKISYVYENSYYSGKKASGKFSNDIKLNYGLAKKIYLKSHYYGGYQIKHLSENYLEYSFGKNDISLFYNYQKNDNIFDFISKQTKSGLNLNLLLSNVKMNFSTGFLSNSDEFSQTKFMEILFYDKYSYKNFDIIFNSRFNRYFNNEIIYRPDYFYISDYALRYNMKYENSLTVGFKISAFSKYKVNGDYEINESQILDAYLKLHITKRFAFILNAMNLEDKYFIGNVPLNGFHVNSEIQWSFYN